MAIFSRKKPDPGPQDHGAGVDEYFKRHSENADAFRAAAKAVEPEALANADEIMSMLQAVHDRDVAAYSFDCKRFGDFLTVFIVRNNRLQGRQPIPEKFSTSINLGKTDRITLAPGRAPDRNGTLRYGAGMRRADDGKSVGFSWSLNHDLPFPREGQVRVAEPIYPWASERREFIRALGETCNDRRADYPPRRPVIDYATNGYPRPAEDDAVVFAGVGIYVLAPAGLGQPVFDKIMAEIAANAPPASVVE